MQKVAANYVKRKFTFYHSYVNWELAIGLERRRLSCVDSVTARLTEQHARRVHSSMLSAGRNDEANPVRDHQENVHCLLISAIKSQCPIFESNEQLKIILSDEGRSMITRIR